MAMRPARGFTLIELMITVAIIGILAAIGYPSYLEHLRKGHRADAQNYLMDIAQREHQYFIDNRSYACDINTLGVTLPSSLTTYYTVAYSTCTTTSFTVKATAAGSQATDGDLTIDNTGAKTPTSKW